MKQLSSGRQRRRGLRSVSRGGPGRADSTRPPAEKVSFKPQQPHGHLQRPETMTGVYHILTVTQAVELSNAAQTVTHWSN